MKKTLVIIGICLLAGYLAFSFLYLKNKSREGVCAYFEIVIDNDDEGRFLDTTIVKKQLASMGVIPQGNPLAEINTYEIEKAILKNQLVQKADVFVTNKNGIKAVITERKPIIRIIPDEGVSYYIDLDGSKMPTSNRQTAYLPVATGSINEDYAKTDLYKFALFLRKNKFWNAQIDQIIVLPNKDIKLIPRVGDQQIILGRVDGCEEKLDRLMAFYEDAMNKAGWNKYSEINLKFDKQVVCTKR